MRSRRLGRKGDTAACTKISPDVHVPCDNGLRASEGAGTAGLGAICDVSFRDFEAFTMGA